MEERSKILLTISHRMKLSRCETQKANPSSHTWKHIVAPCKVQLICKL